MKCILKIGYDQFLLPDDSGVATVLKVLAKGVRVRESLYKGEVRIITEEEPGGREIGMMMVPASTKFLRAETDEPVEVQSGRVVRRHPATAGQKQLTTGQRQLGY